MNFLALFLIISSTLSANVFSLKDTSARFTLTINPKMVSYVSETLSKKVELKDCNKDLAKKLNGELLGQVPTKSPKDGLDFKIDDVEIKLGAKDKFTNKMLSMEQRMLRFFVEENKICK